MILNGRFDGNLEISFVSLGNSKMQDIGVAFLAVLSLSL